MGSCQDKHLDPAQCAQRQEKGISHDLLVKLYEKHPEAYKRSGRTQLITIFNLKRISTRSSSLPPISSIPLLDSL